jgi:hypothetical protein
MGPKQGSIYFWNPSILKHLAAKNGFVWVIIGFGADLTRSSAI